MLTDILAGLAILISIGSYFYTGSVESRIRRQSDARFEFDATVHSPIEAQLQVLSGVLQQLSDAAIKIPILERSAALSELQRGSHQTWYFSMLGCLEALDDSKADQVEQYLNKYWDEMADAINSLNLDIDGQAHLLAVRKVARTGQNFLSSARKGLQATRSRL